MARCYEGRGVGVAVYTYGCHVNRLLGRPQGRIKDLSLKRLIRFPSGIRVRRGAIAT